MEQSFSCCPSHPASFAMNQDGGSGVSRAREGFLAEKKLNLKEKLRNLESVLIVNGETSTLDILATLEKGRTHFWTMARLPVTVLL